MIWIVFDEVQAAAARVLSDTDHSLDPRLIDQPGHPRFGGFALPVSISDAPGYERWTEMLDALDRITAEPGEIFVPLPV